MGGEYEFGDYVVYEPGYGEGQIGRVAGRTPGGNWFVCYSSGCTAANTPGHLLRAATEDEIAEAMPDIGHHRFDPACPDYTPDACYGCEHDMEGRRG